MNIQTNNEKNTIPVTEDDDFSYDGYQVVRGEFFAHTYEPSFTFNSNKVSVNTACIKKLPDTDFVQILVNPDEKKLAVRPAWKMRKIPSVGVPQRQNALPDKLHAVFFLPKLCRLWDGIHPIVINCLES